MNLMVPELMGILKRTFRQAGPAVLLLFLLASCNSTKYLAEDQELLIGQRVRLIDPKRVDNRSDVAYELSTLAQQKPNGNFLFLWPREYFYLANNKVKDTTRIDRFLRNTIGQEPAIYSDSISRRSAAAMAEYLQYQGYFNARTYHEADRGRRNRVNLIYHVEAGKRYVIDSVSYDSPNPILDSLLQLAMEASVLQPGEPLDLNRFDQEKSRLSRFFRNQGFAYFSNAYFDQLEVDTSRRSGYADIFLNILPPKQEETLRRYTVGKVTVITDFAAISSGQSTGFARDTTINGIRFLSRTENYRVRPEILIRNIFINPGEYHSRENFEKTNLSLNGLGIYRFVRINQQIDTVETDVINYQVQLTPSKRMAVGADLDLNYTNRTGINPGIPPNLIGLSVTPSFQNRNVFRGGELFVTSLRAGVEVDPTGNSQFFNTADLGADLSLYVPRFKDFGLYKFVNSIPVPGGGKLLSDNLLTQIKERASTRYSLSYEYLLIRNLYSFTVANARLGYDFPKSPTTNYRIDHLAIDILNPRTEPLFDTILLDNPFLQRSFGEQFFVSFLFRNLEFNRTGRVDRRGRSVTMNGEFEIAGTEVHALNGLLNAFREDNKTLTPGDSATYAKYFLTRLNLSYNKQYTPLTSFASRLIMGFASPFGGAEAVPFVKQFFVGGANTMRAWAPRGLGPGGYVDPLSLEGNNNLRLFQTGDLHLELNLEYRFNLFWQLRGAFFADIGNIWTLDEDPERPGSQFRFTAQPNADGTFVHQPFYRQLAVGLGTGLRIDLSYFIFRLDTSLPVRYNYPQDGFGQPILRDGSAIPESAYWRKLERFKLSDFTFQLGLGYPF
jgi:outer membrane protein insertion porin family